MNALDRFIPTPRLIEVDHEEIRARSVDAYRAARHFDMGRSILIRALFWLRRLPERIAGDLEGARDLALDHLASEGAGFRLLDEEPGAWFVVGAIGKFWEPQIEFVDVAREEFASFAEPGYGKAAWALRADPLGPDRTRLVLELRLTATDDVSWYELRRYYRLLGPFSHFIRRHALSMLARELGESAVAGFRRSAGTEGGHRFLAEVGEGLIGMLGTVADFATPLLQGARAHWGIDEAAAHRRYPGDERVPQPRWGFTHGVELDASVGEVWPELERLLASRRLPYRDASNLRVGDSVSVTPNGPSIPIVAKEPGRYMLAYLESDLDPMEVEGLLLRRFVRLTWLLYLEPLESGRSRCISRYRVTCSDDLATRLTVGPQVTESVVFALDRKMLLALKERVDRNLTARTAGRRHLPIPPLRRP